MPLTVGGGVRTVEDARALLLAGADKVAVNSAAVVAARSGRRYRRENGQPVRRRLGRRQQIQKRAGKSSPTAAAAPPASTRVAHAVRLAELGAGELLVTSMDGDGTQAGYDLELTRAIADAVSVPVIASGRGRHARPPGRGRDQRPCQRGARRLDLPFRHLLDRRGACGAARGRNARRGAETVGRPDKARRGRTVVNHSAAPAAPQARGWHGNCLTRCMASRRLTGFDRPSRLLCPHHRGHSLLRRG